MSKKAQSQWIDQNDKVLLYTKKKTVFAFNFHPDKSFENYFVPVEEGGFYSVILSTDDKNFGGFERVDKEYKYKAEITADGRLGFFCYLPSRTATVFKKQS